MTTEQRTTRDGLPVFGGRTIRNDALAPLVDAFRKLEESLDRAVSLAEASRAKSEERRRAERDKALAGLVDAAFREHERTSSRRFASNQAPKSPIDNYFGTEKDN